MVDSIGPHAPPLVASTGSGGAAASSTGGSAPAQIARLSGPATAAEAYFSPVVQLDPNTQTAVFIVRDGTTGEVVRQFPTERELKAYSDELAAERARAAAAAETADTAEPAPQAAPPADAPQAYAPEQTAPEALRAPGQDTIA